VTIDNVRYVFFRTRCVYVLYMLYVQDFAIDLYPFYPPLVKVIRPRLQVCSYSFAFTSYAVDSY